MNVYVQGQMEQIRLAREGIGTHLHKYSFDTTHTEIPLASGEAPRILNGLRGSMTAFLFPV